MILSKNNHLQNKPWNNLILNGTWTHNTRLLALHLTNCATMPWKQLCYHPVKQHSSTFVKCRTCSLVAVSSSPVTCRVFQVFCLVIGLLVCETLSSQCKILGILVFVVVAIKILLSYILVLFIPQRQPQEHCNPHRVLPLIHWWYFGKYPYLHAWWVLGLQV